MSEQSSSPPTNQKQTTPVRPPAPPPQPAFIIPNGNYHDDAGWLRWWVIAAWFWLLVEIALAIYWLQVIA